MKKYIELIITNKTKILKIVRWLLQKIRRKKPLRSSGNASKYKQHEFFNELS